MDIDIFKIEENLERISQKIKADRNEYQNVLDIEIKRLYDKFKTTKGYSDLIKNRYNPYFENGLKSISFIIKYLLEVFQLIKNVTPKIINTENAINLGITLDKNENQAYNNPMYYIRDLIEYYLDTFREIYFLVENNFIFGALARMRILLEIYCIFNYLLLNPIAIRRYIDHSFVKKYNNKIKYAQNVTYQEELLFISIKEKYKDEFEYFSKNYGWAINLKNFDSFDEIQKIASNNDKSRYDFIKSMYSMLSEYSHSSAFIVYKQNNLSKFNIIAFLVFCGDMSLSIISKYINWIFQNFENMDNDVKYLIPILEYLRQLIFPIHPLD